MKNGVMMQYFEWNLPNDGTLWKRLKEDAEHLASYGISGVWIPPAYKGGQQNDVGYTAYDLYDLGEFNQKGTVRTKYGNKKELQEAIKALHKHGIQVYLDAVMNHKGGADYTEKFLAREVNPANREQPASQPYEIEGWTGFNFPGRRGKYSSFEWHYYHFSGVDYNQANGKKAVYQIVGDGKTWGKGVDAENGNYDYLMLADIDYNHPDVRVEMKKWGMWVAEELDLDGMRLDAVKHINDEFIQNFLETVRAKRGSSFYAVGEYWKNGQEDLKEYLNNVKYETDLFDVPLHYSLQRVSEKGRNYDLRRIFEGALVSVSPQTAVTFVENHDSQAGGSLQSPVRDWFKPLAYGLILLMKEGYPCVFYGDYYGIGGNPSPHRRILEMLLNARKQYAYGEQRSYFDHGNTIGFVRTGAPEYEKSGLAFLMSTGEAGSKTMNVGRRRKGQVWRELTGNIKETVTINENGDGEFTVPGGKLAVWVQQ